MRYLRNRHCGCGDDATLMWVAWAGPLSPNGLPGSADTLQKKRKLGALMRDKFCITGPMDELSDVGESLRRLVYAGDVVAYDMGGGKVLCELAGVPLRESPPTSGFP